MHFPLILPSKPLWRFSWVCFLGMIAGLSSIPVPGFQLFCALGVSVFLYHSETLLFLKRRLLLMGGFAFGYFLVALHWIPCSLHVDWAHYFYLTPIALLGLPLFFALYHVVGIACVPWHRHVGMLRLGLFIALWVGLEIIRAEFLTGFPWASLGYMWTTCLPIAQLAAYVGPYGLSLLSLLWLTVPYVWMSTLFLKPAKWVYTFVMLLSFGAAYYQGIQRMETAQFSPQDPVPMRMVQPNFPQEVVWTPKKMESILRTFVFLSNLGSQYKLRVVLWPEFAMPLAVQRWPWMLDYVKKSIPEDGFLVTNGFRYARSDASSKGYHVHTSILTFGAGGHSVDFYDKHLLLPFGEYIPLRAQVDRILPGMIHKMSAGMGDFERGIGAKTCCADTLPPFIPMLCHEVIFSGKFHGAQTDKATWILNLTNDGWFLDSLEPYQHLEMARMRAIEFGLPLVRVANTGVSAVIDALGRTILSIPYGRATTADFLLPPPLEGKTFYARIMQADPYAIISRILCILMLLKLLTIFFQKLMRRRRS